MNYFFNFPYFLYRSDIIKILRGNTDVHPVISTVNEEVAY